MDYKELKKAAIEVREKYDEVAQQKWGAREFMEGFVADVGDLMKLIQKKEGLRPDDKGDIDGRIQHELADCLWSVIVIADQLGIELDEIFIDEMDDLKKRF